MDAEGNLWSAQWEGARLVRYSPEGVNREEFRFPIAKISCVAFGGETYQDLYVTTANHPWDAAVYEQHRAGAVFRWKHAGLGKREFMFPAQL